MAKKKNHKYSTFLHSVTFDDDVLVIEGRPFRSFFILLGFLVGIVWLFSFFLVGGETPFFVFALLGFTALFVVYGLWDSFYSRSSFYYDLKTGVVRVFKRKASNQFLYEGSVDQVSLSVRTRQRRVHYEQGQAGTIKADGGGNVSSGLAVKPIVVRAVELAVGCDGVKVYYPLSNIEKWEHTTLDSFVAEWEQKLGIAPDGD